MTSAPRTQRPGLTTDDEAGQRHHALAVPVGEQGIDGVDVAAGQVAGAAVEQPSAQHPGPQGARQGSRTDAEMMIPGPSCRLSCLLSFGEVTNRVRFVASGVFPRYVEPVAEGAAG